MSGSPWKGKKYILYWHFSCLWILHRSQVWDYFSWNQPVAMAIFCYSFRQIWKQLYIYAFYNISKDKSDGPQKCSKHIPPFKIQNSRLCTTSTRCINWWSNQLSEGLPILQTIPASETVTVLHYANQILVILVHHSLYWKGEHFWVTLSLYKTHQKQLQHFWKSL
jgi:hypothetical protein